MEESSSAAVAAPLEQEQALSHAAAATAIIEWDRRGRLVDDESFVQNNAPAVARSFYDLFDALDELGEAIAEADELDDPAIFEAMAKARDALNKATQPPASRGEANPNSPTLSKAGA